MRTPAKSRAANASSSAENWASFLSVLDEERIVAAERGLQRMLQVERLDGLRFLDIGSGSGLSSLAARRLGARVHSFDYDPQSVACTNELRRRYFPDDSDWIVERGSALDADYLRGLGPVRHRLFVGRPASHRRDVAGAGKRDRFRLRPAASCSSPSTTTRARRAGAGSGSSGRITACPAAARKPFAVAVTIPAEAKARRRQRLCAAGPATTSDRGRIIAAGAA